ncbi:Fe-S cluster protein [Desulfonema ishimotonii]|uniref:Fe-S cluster protein n=1 Tax=Desulfonema ishimotonii TaxID=45657 RepID=A0A401G1P3_9BACT|nr:DUF3786 domain-containing protein [Desulfonema ishimotonii]GBC63131.1 Fe-S cluster protein [Desulfonema ishimotonii]
MAKPKNAMEIFKLLDKSNCRECGKKTCLAFAGAVFTGQKAIGDCPKLGPEIIERYATEPARHDAVADIRDDFLEKLKNEITQTDLAEAADRLRGRFSGGKLTLKVLGKDFSVDGEGRLFSDIHVNPWITVPFLSHVLYGKGLPASGKWVSFRELKNGQERYPLFQKRCEAAMKNLADLHPGFFDNMVHLFNGKQVEEQFRSDISVVLHPLPTVPVMVCYWMPDDGLASDLRVFFDRTADENLDIGSLFSLGAGLTQMFEKITQRHGLGGAFSY